MLTMQPLMILAESETTDGAQRYRVRFDCQGKEIEYVFTVSTENDITGVTAEEEFTNSTFQDPLSSTLCQAILKFHESRQR